MLTTKDNPFNPYTQYEQWLMYDTDNGYNTNQYLARILEKKEKSFTDYTEEDIDDAIEEIINYDILEIYEKV